MGELIERVTELEQARGVLEGAAGGGGELLLVSGTAGIGRSALVRRTAEMARAMGMAVLTASPTPVSSSLTYALVRDWLTDHARRELKGDPPFDGPALELAQALSGAAWAVEGWTLADLDHALTWTLKGLAESQPLLLVVDDVQWADVGSVQLLDLLSARIQQLPATLLLGHRAGEPPTAAHVLDRIGARARRLDLEPLSEAGVAELLRGAGNPPMSARELHRLTGGVPFLVREVLRSGGREGTPRSVVAAVTEQLDRLGPRAVALARAAAVLGDEAERGSLAALTGIEPEQLADTLAVLDEAGILEVDGWLARPARPLLAEAILSSMTPSTRSELHRAAARHLLSGDKPRRLVAAHLVHTLPGGDQDLVELLRATGEEALADGAPQVAARQLLRAVAETGPDGADVGLLTRAASAHLAAGLRDDAYELWSRALDRAEDPVVRARLLADVGDVQMTMGHTADAAASYRTAIGALTDAGHSDDSRELRHLRVRIGLTRTMYDGAATDLDDTATAVLEQPVTDDTHTDRLLCALTAADLAVRSVDRERARDLALRALGAGALLAEETSERIGFYVATSVLTWTDSYAEALHALDAAVADARDRGSVLGLAGASYYRGLVHFRQGRMKEALSDLAPALQLREGGWPDFADPALAVAALAEAALGRLDAARALEPVLRAAAARGQFAGAPLIAAVGVVRAAHGDHERALEDYARAARLMGDHRDNASIVQWRELSAWSSAALGRVGEARALGEEALDHARRWGAPRALGFALRTLARVSPVEDALTYLAEAEQLFERVDCGDQLVLTWIQRAQVLLTEDPASRAEAVGVLRRARERARAAGLVPITARATRMLVRAGETVVEEHEDGMLPLTPGERRVVELAAAGHTNRQIAHQLFVTVKAVEWHLSNAYRKLGISSRTELPGVLYSDSDPDSSSAM